MSRTWVQRPFALYTVQLKKELSTDECAPISEKTYACAHASCINKAEGAPVFNTWSALQAHIKSDHPPTCPHASCRGQRFSTTSHLRRHLSTVHQEAEEIPEGEQLALRFRRKRYSRAKKQPQQSEVQTEQQASSHGHPQQQNDEPDGQHDEDEEDEEEEETEEEATQIEDDDDDALDSDCDLPWHCIETNCGKSFATVRLAWGSSWLVRRPRLI